MAGDDDIHHESDLVRTRETKTRGPIEWIYHKVYGHYPRRACYNIRELYIQCVLATDCIREKRDFEACRKEPECAAERTGLSQCRMMSLSPRMKLRGNVWDQRTDAEMKEVMKNERVKQRKRELGEDVDETHELLKQVKEMTPKDGPNIFKHERPKEQAPPL
eukprot:TRINITY_DN17410_c0_g1_i1.p1 TRINITY_DN17410_c0_g1~~TRINITY_DN17410_c0_g1_i1.p1  ORF type:complete len:162 (+),score=55.06 TRINITY_DN17410_c0_g1_i1:126-611(+)